MKFKLIKMVNPKLEECKEAHDFLNKGFFDCEVENFFQNQIYYVIYTEKKIVAARKILTNFNEYYKQTKWSDRLGEFVKDNKNTVYLQALAVEKEYRKNGFGSLLLKEALKDIGKDVDVFCSLCDTNTIKDKYINDYGFEVLKEADNRLVIGRIKK